MLFNDFVQDLEEFDEPEIEMACKLCRQNAKNKFFPKPGDLREIILAGRRERASIERIGVGNLDERFYKANGYYPPARPIRWWQRPRELWGQGWHDSEIPAHEIIGFHDWERARQRRTRQNEPPPYVPGVQG